MAEQIGKVILEDTFYPGEDLYCDGDVEDTLLSIVKQYPESEYPKIIEKSESWPVLYHLSHFRENIVNWLPVDKSMKVLEVGSGCGAITGALAAKAGSVTCVDLSKKRSMINAYRHKDCDNITIKLGNFKDIEPTLDTDYDYIFLIGVFEYGQGYMGSDTPYHDFMRILRKHCAADGRIVIAIENRYGLKYFAGCKEDHVGSYFEGIEDYPGGGGVRTFSRKKLIEIMESCGVEEYHFYYPYPDYKFMTTVYSDAYLPRVGELTNNLRNFDRERMLLFDEKNVFDGLIRDGMFADFSNSFLVVIGKAPEQIYAKFSNDRKAEYAICTSICEDASGKRYVEKMPDLVPAKAHVEQIAEKYALLQKKYEGSGLLINQCEVSGQGVRLAYLTGRTLEEALDECIHRDDEAGFRALLAHFSKIAAYHEETPVCDYDLIFSNIVIDQERESWNLIDYEWTCEKALSGADLTKRAMFIYCIGPQMRRKWLFEHGIAQECGVRPDNLESLQEEELIFQHEVTGARASMYELYDRMGQPCIFVREQIAAREAERAGRYFQIYEDRGNGFSEAESRFVPNVYQNEHDLQLRLEFDGGIQALRLDPSMEPCMLYDLQICINGESVYTLSDGQPAEQGMGAVTHNGTLLGGDTLVFTTEDPNLTVALTGMELKEHNILTMTAKVEWLSKRTALYLCKTEEKRTKRLFFGK